MNTGEVSKYVDLAPTDKADEAGIYSDALNYATNNPNVSNIALTGPYGSGKSSVIKTFLNRYNKPTLQISLAAFLPEAGATGGKVSKQEIERSILQQMLYGADANNLPLSRFKRIQSPKWWSPVISLFIIFGCFACWYLFQQRSEILSGNFFLPMDYTNWFNFTCFVVGFLFLWQALHHIYLKSYGLSLKSVSLKDIQITPDAAAGESILNRHLDEIIYFFQSTKYDLVIIEDLDRFNNPDIFVTLREINSLINANAGVKRKIRFLYALRDNMFVNTERTKFFEFIIPVIPIINTSNSIDKVLEQGERLSLDERLDRQFLREVSRYLNDLRLIQNIFNEYVIYVSNLETDGENNLDANKLLAVLIYKNVLPSDFEALHQEKGILAGILSRHDAYIAKAEAGYKSQISDLEEQISTAEKQVPADLDELRKIYAMALINKTPQGYTTIEFNGHGNIPLQMLSSHQEFEQIIEMQEVVYHTPQNHTQRISISGLQNEVNPKNSYQDRKKEIEHKSTEFKDSASRTMRKLRAKISSLRVTKFNEIIRTDAKGTEELFNAFGDNRELVKFLVFEGFLDDTYYQYTSLFHSGRLSPNDNKFLIQIRSFNNPEPDFQVDNPKEVIAAMRDEDFRQNFALNKTVVDCLFNNPTDYDVQISKLLEFISSSFDECSAFFAAYYARGKYVTEFMSALVAKWPEFVSVAIASPDSFTHIGRIIAHLPEKHLTDLHQQNTGISEYLSINLSEILALRIDFDPARLKLLQVEVKDLSSIEDFPGVTRLLFQEGLYQVSIENVEFIFRAILGSTDLTDLQTKHYSTVLRTENTALIAKVEQDLDHYLRKVLLRLEHNTEEDVSTIQTVIGHDEIDGKYLEKFLEKQSANLPALDQVPNRLHSWLFQLQKIEASWENCLAFISSESFEAETLTAYLQQNDISATLSTITIDGGKSAFPLRKFLIENNGLSDDLYRAYVRTLPNQFKKFPEDIDFEKLQILVEEEKIEFSEESSSFVGEDNDLQVLFVAKNIGFYLESPDQITIDDEFREKLLNSEISDDQRLKIIEHMDLALLTNFPTRASVIGPIFDRTGADVSVLIAEAAQAIIIESKPIATQISLFNRCQKALSDDQVWNTVHNLPKPFSEITPGWRQPTIPNTPDNFEFVNWLENRGIISSWKLTVFDDIRIHTFRT